MVQKIEKKNTQSQCLKNPQNVSFDLATNVCPIKSDMSGNTVWQQASGFQKNGHFGLFNEL